MFPGIYDRAAAAERIRNRSIDKTIPREGDTPKGTPLTTRGVPFGHNHPPDGNRVDPDYRTDEAMTEPGTEPETTSRIKATCPCGPEGDAPDTIEGREALAKVMTQHAREEHRFH